MMHWIFFVYGAYLGQYNIRLESLICLSASQTQDIQLTATEFQKIDEAHSIVIVYIVRQPYGGRIRTQYCIHRH